MADQYELGLYTATVVEACVTEKTGPDKDTGIEVTKATLMVRVALNTHHSKTGADTVLEAQPEVRVYKPMSGGCLEGKGLEITMGQLRVLAGDLLEQYGETILVPPHNEKLVGREVKVLCSVNERKPQYRNWELWSPAAAAPKPPASKQTLSALGAKLGLKPVVKAKPAAKPATAAVGAPEDFV